LPIQLQKASRTPNGLDKNRFSPQNVTIKTTSTENRKRILKGVGVGKQIMYKGKPIKITTDFSMETLKARKALNELFQTLNENNFSSRILSKAITQD
jgi:hypothetical protein